MAKPAYLSYVSDESWEFVSQLEFSTRSANTLMKLDVKNMDEMFALTQAKILAVKGSGRKTLREISDFKGNWELRTEHRNEPTDLVSEAMHHLWGLNEAVRKLKAFEGTFYLAIDSEGKVGLYRKLG